MTSFIFRHDKRYRAEIRLHSIDRIVPNTRIANNIRAWGFVEVSVSGSGSKRVAEGAWALNDATISVRKIQGTIDRSKSEYPLAQLLEALGEAEERVVHKSRASRALLPKKIPSKQLGAGKKKTRRKRRKS